jgi:hypothetical protein
MAMSTAITLVERDTIIAQLMLLVPAEPALTLATPMIARATATIPVVSANMSTGVIVPICD